LIHQVHGDRRNAYHGQQRVTIASLAAGPLSVAEPTLSRLASALAQQLVPQLAEHS
jgi:hypothetical protein